MKTIIIHFLSVLLLTMYAITATATHHKAKKSHTKRELLSHHTHSMSHSSVYDKGFVTISYGLEFDPFNDLEYKNMLVDLQYGRHFGRKSFFSAGVRGHHEVALVFRYGMDFTRNWSWVPGLDASVLIGRTWSSPKPVDSGQGNNNVKSQPSLGFGFEFGFYLKTFITKVHAIFLRTGVVHENNQSLSNFDFKDSSAYIHLMLRWHF